MTPPEFGTLLKDLADSEVSAALLTVILSAPIAAYVGLYTYRHQARELIDGAVTWQWTDHSDGSDTEEPYLAIQNRSAVPAYIIRARWLRGLFFRTEAVKYAFSYPEPMDGNFPLEITAAGVTSFPLSTTVADAMAAKAPWWSKAFGYVLRRSYLWIEISTISGRKLLIAANDATSFHKRPLWLDGRWIPAPKPDWMKSQTSDRS